ncbi:MAG: PIN domain-containing protein [Bryobacteraceae bacterium]
MKRYVLDTNLVVRFLTNDHPTMSRAAAALFEESATGKTDLLLEATIVAEAVFVLTGFYKRPRAEVADALRDLITGCRLRVPNSAVVLDALARFKAYPVDFPDALVAAVAVSEGIPVVSFDRDFDKFQDSTRVEP